VVVIDQVHHVPADASVLVLGAVAGDVVTDAIDAAKLLGIDVQQFAGRGMLLAHDRCGLKPVRWLTPVAMLASPTVQSSSRTLLTCRARPLGVNLACLWSFICSLD